MIKIIDDFLNNITMYRLMLYYLIALCVVATIFAILGLLPFDFQSLMLSAAVLITGCWVTNKIFEKIFNVPTNVESVYISALILTLILTPIRSLEDLLSFIFIAALAMASKYILATGGKHIFNPAACSVAVSSLTINFAASWWVGTSLMLPAVLLGGLLVLRKIQRFDLVFSFFLIYLMSIWRVDLKTLLSSAMVFFALVMLTEPLTTPPTRNLRILYGGLVGASSFYLTPEIALILGNIFSYLVSPKEKLLLKLKEKIQLSKDIYEFVFGLEKKIKYAAGQYMEWTLSHHHSDSRGNRRFFTLASSPTEDHLRLGVKFYINCSSFKKALLSLKAGDQIMAGQLSGEFTLPKDLSQKLVFIAGGIGITPFRSMIKYLIDRNEKRDITLLYANKTAQDIVYKNIFDEAFQKLRIKTVYVNTDTMGYIDEARIKRETPDIKERTFYIAGPHSMVDAFEKVLKGMGIQGSQIKIDFFPGYV